ncbi:MAG: BON domain-containing protein [Gammaproteobacteria bacterium]|nr:BON domain-containing protein [Gammaproteobacteria bacterium]
MKLTYSMLVVLVIPWMSSSIAFATAMDDRIEDSITNSYVFKTYLNDDDIDVDADDGVVVLSGKVTDETHKALAEDTAASVPDVKGVDNRLEITGTQPAASSDAWLLAKVKTTLLFHKNVSATTDVTVKDGMVSLRGDADSQAQKDLTTEYARDIEGVRDVDNRMTVKSGSAQSRTETIRDKIDDASITAQVKMMLLGHRSTSAFRTKVETQDGIVSLTGKARSPAEIDLVTKLVNDVKGVRDVKNMMVVDSSV